MGILSVLGPRVLDQTLRKLDSRVVGDAAIRLSQFGVGKSEPTYLVRRLIDLAQPENPLKSSGSALPPIDIVTISAPDTFDFAEASILAAVQTSQNPVRNAYVIVPDSCIEQARKKIPSAIVLPERTVIPEVIFKALKHFSAVGRDKWVLCQVLGMYFARNSDIAGTLVVDADTYLLGERTWVDNSGRQVLSFSHEYHRPYEDHCRSVFGARKEHHGLSYVTHYMLMQPDVLTEIFPDDSWFERWITSGNPELQSAVADYHTYGRWLVEHHPRRVAMARWDNNRFVWPFPAGTNPQKSLERIRELNASFLSASSHRYLER